MPKGRTAYTMRLLSVDYKGDSLLLDMTHKVLRLCTKQGKWSIVTHIPDTPSAAVVDPIDNGIWVVTTNKELRYSSSYHFYHIIPEE